MSKYPSDRANEHNIKIVGLIEPLIEKNPVKTVPNEIFKKELNYEIPSILDLKLSNLTEKEIVFVSKRVR